MNIKKIKVYHLFWFVTVLILLIGLSEINNPDLTVSINVYDTYYVISHYHLAIALFLSYFLMGLGYWGVQKVFKKQLIKSLTIIHSVILIGSFLLYWIVVIYGKLHLNDRTYNYFDDYASSNVILVSELFLIAFVGLPVYIINLLIGILRKKNI